MPTAAPRPPQSASGTHTHTADGVELARWPVRVIAAILDWFLAGAVINLATGDLLVPFSEALTRQANRFTEASEAGRTTVEMIDFSPYFPALAGALLLSLVITFAFHATFWQYLGATPGQMICNIRVVPAGRGQLAAPGVVPAEDRIGWRKACLRSAVWSLPLHLPLLFIVTVLDGLWPLWHPRRQSLHDLAAGTQVVRVQRVRTR